MVGQYKGESMEGLAPDHKGPDLMAISRGRLCPGMDCERLSKTDRKRGRICNLRNKAYNRIMKKNFKIYYYPNDS